MHDHVSFGFLENLQHLKGEAAKWVLVSLLSTRIVTNVFGIQS